MMSMFKKFRKDEDGVASVEFVILFPFVFFLFMMAYDVGLHMIRHAMLERGMDLAVRHIRLSSASSAPSHDEIKEMICDGALLLPLCEENMNIELRSNDMFAWSDWPVTPICADREEDIRPVNIFEPGGSNELMLIRACAAVKPLFTVRGWSIFKSATTQLEAQRHDLKLPSANTSHTEGEYYFIVASSAFVNEPS